jgi:hypothetical protein
MTGGYVLAGELVTHEDDLVAGVAAYEHELRDYVLRNQDAALAQNADQEETIREPMETGEATPSDDLPDFGQMVEPIAIKNYYDLVR